MWFFVVMFFLPLVLYGIAWVSHFIAKAFGATNGSKNARHALFWALAILSPVLIAKALIGSVFIQISSDFGQAALDTLNIILAFAILRIWGAMLAEAKGFSSSLRVSSAILAIMAGVFGIIYLGSI